MYLLVLFAAFECGDGVLVEICGEGDTLGDPGRRGRSLKNAVVLLSIGGLLTGSSCRDWSLKRWDHVFMTWVLKQI